MNFRMNHRNRMLAISAAALTGITLVAWQQQPFAASAATNYSDTIPNREKKIRGDRDQDKKPGKGNEQEEIEMDLDKDFEKDFEKNFKKDFGKDFKKNFEMDFEKYFEKDFGKNLEREMKHLEKSLKHLEKISIDNLKNLDTEISLNLDIIDLDEIRTDVDLALKDADLALNQAKLHKIQDDLRIKLDKIDFDDLKISLEQSLKDLEINLDKAGKQNEKAKEDMKDINLDFSESMRAGLEEMQKGKSVMEKFQEMVSRMDEEKLLNSSGDYTVELKEDELYINDKKQPEAITAKYKKYFSDGNTRIRKKDGNTSVSKRKVTD